VPDGQAGMASGMNSSSRQLGQCLGVAVAGTVLDGSLHGPMQTGFPSAARGSWLIMAGCGLLVLMAGMAGNSSRPPRPRGRHARQPGTTARRQRLRNRGPAIRPPPATLLRRTAVAPRTSLQSVLAAQMARSPSGKRVGTAFSTHTRITVGMEGPFGRAEVGSAGPSRPHRLQRGSRRCPRRSPAR
jgi:hypothetical protein